MIIILFIALVNCIRDADVIEQEIRQIEYLIEIQQEKVHYLKELRNQYLDNNLSLGVIDEDLLRDITHKKPFKKPSERTFTNRMLKKSQFNFSIVQEAGVISTFQYRTQNEQSSSQMLFTLNRSHIAVYDMNGIPLTSRDIAPWDQVITSARSDDPIIGIMQNETFQIMKIENIKIEIPVEGQTRPKIKFEIQINEDLQLQVGPATAACYATIKGNKYLLFGNEQGDIKVYHRNGTIIGEKNTGQESIRQILKSYPNVLYQTDHSFGFINPQTLELSAPICENLPFKIQHLTLDLSLNTAVYALAESGEVYVFEVRVNEPCRMRHKLVQDQILNGKLISLRSFLMVVQSHSGVVFNTSEIFQEDQFDAPLQVDFDTLHINQSLQSIKGNGASHYLLVNQQFEDHSLVSYYEVVMPIKKEQDLFNNLRLPIIILAIVIVIGYQFWYKKDKKPKNKQQKQMDDSEIEKLLQGIPGVGKQSQVKNMSPPRKSEDRDIPPFKRERPEQDRSKPADPRQKLAQNILYQNKKYV